MPWLSFVQTVFIIPLCSIPPCTSCKLQVEFGAGSPRKFLDFNSLKSHFLGLQVIKTGYCSDFNLESDFYYSKYIIMKNLTNFWWKPVWISLWDDVWGMSAKTFIHTVNDYCFHLKLFSSPLSTQSPFLHTSTFPLVSPERTAIINFCNTTTGFLARWCLRNELKNFYSVNMSLQIQVILLIGWTKFSATQNSQPRSG